MTGALMDHEPVGAHRAIDHAPQIHIDRRLPVIERSVSEFAPNGDSRVVEHIVEPAVITRHTLNQSLHFGMAGHIHLCGARLAPGTLNGAGNLLRTFDIEVRYGDKCTSPAQRLAERAPNPGRATGDDRHFPFKLEHAQPPCCLRRHSPLWIVERQLRSHPVEFLPGDERKQLHGELDLTRDDAHELARGDIIGIVLWHNEKMGVRNAIAVNHVPDSLGLVHLHDFPADPLCDEQDLGGQRIGDVGKVINMHFWDHHALALVDGAQVHEGHDLFILPDDACW